MTKPKKTARQIAEGHWQYNKGILLILDPTLETVNKKYLDLLEYFYIEVFVHGYKHSAKEVK